VFELAEASLDAVALFVGAGTARRASDPHGLHRSRRAGLSAVCAIRRCSCSISPAGSTSAPPSLSPSILRLAMAIQKPRRCSNNPRSRPLRNPDRLRRPGALSAEHADQVHLPAHPKSPCLCAARSHILCCPMNASNRLGLGAVIRCYRGKPTSRANVTGIV
jgi:hypothetical protein